MPHSVLVLSGPNLDRLGKREPHIYGTTTLAEIHERLGKIAASYGASIDCRQSAHEGDLITWIGSAQESGFTGILLNAGSLTHTSIGLLDAVRLAGVPVVEVHVSNPEAREKFRRRSYVARVAIAKVAGFGAASYELALNGLLRHLDEQVRTEGA
ncbi:MAG: 3-dehydroquinate dehydratase [Polyangiaceae bacterium]|nr:3-dehydroquinate dehydratase [Polyangiaceae bacterium]